MGEDTNEPALWRHGASSAPLVGVGGWLALFLFFCGILRPLLCGFAELGLYTIASERPDEAGTAAFYAVISGVNGGLSVVTAVALWRLWPIGVALAKATILFAVTESWLLYVHGLSDGFVASLQGGAGSLPGFVMGTLVGAAWFAYFVRSRRVRATYSQPDATPAR